MRKIVLVAAVVAVVAILATTICLSLATTDKGNNRNSRTDCETPEDRDHNTQPSAILRPQGPGRSGQRDDGTLQPSKDAPPVPLDPSEAHHQPDLVWELRGRIVAQNGGVAPPTRVSACLLVEGNRTPCELATTSDAGGHFILDLTPLFAKSSGKRAGVEARFLHPDYLPEVTRFDLNEAVPSDGRRVFRTEVQLTPRHTLSGVVIDPSGALVPDVTVAVFLVDDLDVPVLPPLCETRTDENGEYRLSIARFQRVAVSAAHGSYRPQFVEVQPTDKSPFLVPTITLQRGYEIRGEVLVAGRPAENVSVKVIHEESYAQWRTSRDWIVEGTRSVTFFAREDNGSVGCIVTRAYGRTDITGAFLLCGLDAVPFRLTLTGRGVPLGQTAGFDAASRDVRPPATVSFNLSGVDVVFKMVGDNIPEDTRITVSQGAVPVWQGVFSDGLPPRVCLPNNAQFQCVVTASRYEPFHTTIVTGASASVQEVFVELKKRDDLPSLNVVFSRAMPTEFRSRVYCVFHRADSKRPSLTRKADCTGEKSCCVFDVPEGDYNLEIRLGSPFYSTGFLMAADVKAVRVDRGGAKAVNVPLTLGGRLRVVVRSRSRPIPRYWCRVFDSSGQLLSSCSFQKIQTKGQKEEIDAQTKTILEASSPMLPGRYRLRLLATGGVILREVDVTIEAGRTQAEELTL